MKSLFLVIAFASICSAVCNLDTCRGDACDDCVLDEVSKACTDKGFKPAGAACTTADSTNGQCSNDGTCAGATATCDVTACKAKNTNECAELTWACNDVNTECVSTAAVLGDCTDELGNAGKCEAGKCVAGGVVTPCDATTCANDACNTRKCNADTNACDTTNLAVGTSCEGLTDDAGNAIAGICERGTCYPKDPTPPTCTVTSCFSEEGSCKKKSCNADGVCAAEALADGSKCIWTTAENRLDSVCTNGVCTPIDNPKCDATTCTSTACSKRQCNADGVCAVVESLTGACNTNDAVGICDTNECKPPPTTGADCPGTLSYKNGELSATCNARGAGSVCEVSCDGGASFDKFLCANGAWTAPAEISAACKAVAVESTTGRIVKSSASVVAPVFLAGAVAALLA